jgi:hypothetical protein
VASSLSAVYRKDISGMLHATRIVHLFGNQRPAPSYRFSVLSHPISKGLKRLQHY